MPWDSYRKEVASSFKGMTWVSRVGTEVERLLHGFYRVAASHLRSSISLIGSWDRPRGNLETKDVRSQLCCSPKIEKEQRLTIKTRANPLL